MKVSNNLSSGKTINMRINGTKITPMLSLSLELEALIMYMINRRRQVRSAVNVLLIIFIFSLVKCLK